MLKNMALMNSYTVGNGYYSDWSCVTTFLSLYNIYLSRKRILYYDQVDPPYKDVVEIF